MPFRFRRSIRIAPDVRLGLGKRGVSASATLPGTGISYTVTTPHGAGRRRSPQPGSWWKWLGSAAIVAALAWWFGWFG